ncbi:MAG: sugar phosphorylase [Phototrophicales bacterium]|nr:MAG: sugar phosphorylase [Phototrophicales bacterium]
MNHHILDNSTSYDHIRQKLAAIYGEEQAPSILQQLIALVGNTTSSPSRKLSLSEKDVMLICYGDHVRRDGETPLQTLHQFLRDTLHPEINTVHILPFYPYSSDDGFSVIDYYAVNPDFGSWDDVAALSSEFQLMFDAVFNHISSQSAWFQGFLRGEQPYTDYFVTVEPDTDLSAVVRPRSLPLLTTFETAHGVKYVWTTFSEDQIDLNFANPDVLIEMLKVLLFYVKQGARFIRLDAIAFLWKVPGTSSLHLPETHLIIQLMRDVLDLIAPETVIITETNVPHQENLSYFGDGYNEAQLVYQFSLPPLILHSLYTGNATKLTQWATTIERVREQTTFFNFTASHDGIGLRPATGILTDDEIQALVEMTEQHGGHVSYKDNSDGSKSPYELNITYFDAITHPDITAQHPELAVQRFMVSQAMMLAVIGMPGIYFNNMFGLRNDYDGVAKTGRFRSINREKFDADSLLHDLSDERSIRHKVYSQYKRLLKIRTEESAFHPLGEQSVLNLHPALFALHRTSPSGEAHIIALHNVTEKTISVEIPHMSESSWHDLFTGTAYLAHDGNLSLSLQPYQIVWLKPSQD